MRIVFVGAGELTVRTAELLIGRGHDLIIVEQDKKRIEELSETLDCGFLHGDGSNPEILREVSPKKIDALFCLTNNDQVNIIASLVGKTLGFKRTITMITNTAFENICRELGLEDTIIPSRTFSRYLADMVEGLDILELSTVIKYEARFFTFTIEKGGTRSVEDMNLPEEARAVCYYRGQDFYLVEDGTRFKESDEVVILTHSKNLNKLRERWEPKQSGDVEIPDDT